MEKYKFEWLYDNKKDETLIIIWLGTQIVDKRTMNGVLSSYSKEKVRKELTRELIEEKSND